LRDVQSGRYGSDGFLEIDGEIDIKGYIELKKRNNNISQQELAVF